MTSLLKVDEIQDAAGKKILQNTGSVLQVVQSTMTSTPSSTSTSFVDAGLSVTITPTSSSSKILVAADFTVGSGSSSGGMVIQLVRGSTSVFNRGVSYSAAGAVYSSNSFSHLDSPATTSATTYKLQYLTQAAASTAYFNAAYSGYTAPTAHITAIEISA